MTSKRFAIALALGMCAATAALAQDGSGTRSGQAEGPTQGKLNGVDGSFVGIAHSVNQAEIKVGKLAQEKATRQSVKDFGAMLEKHHALAQQQLDQVIPKTGLETPTELMPNHQALYDKLSKLSEAEFDRQFIDSMIKGHEEAIREFERETHAGQNPALKSYAELQLPMLKAHLQVARIEQKEMAKKTAQE